MKWFSLPAAAMLVALGPTAHADPFARSPAAPGGASYPAGYAVPVATGVDTDFPEYPPGFSSYRGLGFMGRCCQPISPVAQHAWDGYCDGTDCREPGLGQSFLDNLQVWMHQPRWTCGQKGCRNPCGGPGKNWWPVVPSPHEPLCLKLQRWRAQWAGMFGSACAGSCCDACVEDGFPLEPAEDERQQAAEPMPVPAVPDAPAPQAAGEIRPQRPSPPTSDRSAWRSFPWPLPGSRSDF